MSNQEKNTIADLLTEFLNTSGENRYVVNRYMPTEKRPISYKLLKTGISNGVILPS